MFSNASEKTLDKVYDWITFTYYSPYPEMVRNEITDWSDGAIGSMPFMH